MLLFPCCHLLSPRCAQVPPADLTVGCVIRGFWNGGVQIAYEGSACKPPPPPAPPDARYWDKCVHSAFQYRAVDAHAREANAQVFALHWTMGYQIRLRFRTPVSVLEVTLV